MKFILNIDSEEGRDILAKAVQHYGTNLPCVDRHSALAAKDLLTITPTYGGASQELIRKIADLQMLYAALGVIFPTLADAVDMEIGKKLGKLVAAEAALEEEKQITLTAELAEPVMKSEGALPWAERTYSTTTKESRT